ncbi:hypothetical protein GX586_16205, partial [bacterium]|nr:hypothetical protein [bacterium]
MMYDDGYAAYLNGTILTSRYAPSNISWNSPAAGSRSDALCLQAEAFDFPGPSALVDGTNVLAIHVMNATSSNIDCLAGPFLSGSVPNPPDSADRRYFTAPTPGRANANGLEDRGPRITGAAHAPDAPYMTIPLAVTARVAPQTGAVASVTLRYRVMYNAESATPMYDDGAHGDGAAGDGVFGAAIPAGIATPGQMIRYYLSAVDTFANTSRWPLFITAADEQYLGTISLDPSAPTNAPVYHWFVQNTNAAETFAGTRCSLYYDGEFYDNVFVAIKGATSALNNPGTNLFKNPHKWEFTGAHEFRYDAGGDRINDLIVHSMYNDGAYCRDYLSWETFWRAGVPASTSFYVHVRQNGAWHSFGLMIEQVDRGFLRRRGWPDQCALYKAVGSAWLRNLTGLEKHYPDDGDFTDIAAFVHGLTNGTPADRLAFACDHLNIPEIANALAAHRIIQEYDGRHNNMYYYRDFNNRNLWSIFPWDKDQTFGHYWGSSYWYGFYGTNVMLVTGANDLYDQGNGMPSDINPHGLGMSSPYFSVSNKLYDLFFELPGLHQMFLRRLRSLMDEILQPPDTPGGQLFFEGKINELYPLLKHYADTDRARWKWPSRFYWSGPVYLDEGIDQVTNLYLKSRRVHLFHTHSITNGSVIPLEQPARPTLEFGALESAPASGNQDEEYIELRNPNAFAVDISGWRLSNAVSFVFAPGTVIPTGFPLYVSPDFVAFRNRASSPRGGEGRFVVGDYSGHLSSWGETIYLLDRDGVVVAATNYPSSPSDAQRTLRVTEMMYHPTNPPAGSTYAGEDFEFIELMNTGTNALDLNGVAFTDGITFAFTNALFLQPGAAVLLVRNAAAFASLYATNKMFIAGAYDGLLNNAGETITIDDALSGTILSYTYSDAWYPETDGGGHSLEIVNAFAAPV